MSNEKIVLDLDKGLSAEQTASIPRLFKERLEEVVTGNPEDISAIHLEDENDTMILIGKSGNALCRLVTMSILEDELEVVNAIWGYLSPEEVDVIFENGGVYEVPCSECISIDYILYVIDSMVDSQNVSKEEFLFYIDSEDKPKGYLN